jgi:hypothetical protein
VITLYGNLSDAKRQAVSQKMNKIFEVNTPSLQEFKKSTKKRGIDDAGYRIRKIESMPGGHGFYSGASQGYNEPYAAQTASMWVYPVRYALSMQYDVALLESLKEGKSEGVIKLLEALELHNEAAAKRFNQLVPGDGSGAIAYSNSAIGGVGPATLNCETAAALSPGHTKGAKRLEKGHKYESVNPATGAVRGVLQVLVPGGASCQVNVLSGTVAVGDAITDLGSYMNAFRGVHHLLSPTPRVLQGIDTALRPEFNCPEVDLAGAVPTPADIETVRTKVKTRRNDGDEVTLKCFTTHSNMSALRQQGFGYRMYVVGADGGGNVSTGIAQKYIENGVKFVEDADWDEDRFTFVEAMDIERFEEKSFSVADFDDNEWRMWLGANGFGSDIYMRALTWRGNWGLIGDGRSGAIIRRANQTNVVQQYNA